jgi:hypothetical protein
MKNKSFIISFVLITSLSIIGCKKDDAVPSNPADPNESELITTVKLIFADSAGIEPNRIFSFSDPDGDGGNAPTVFDTIQLNSFKTYNVSILLLDESKSPADTISNEVLAEADDHMFFFFHNGSLITTTYVDVDSNGLGIGLQTKWVTSNASNGTSKVVLKHQPGTKDGTFNPGEVDVEIPFISIVQ